MSTPPGEKIHEGVAFGIAKMSHETRLIGQYWRLMAPFHQLSIIVIHPAFEVMVVLTDLSEICISRLQSSVHPGR